MTARKVISLIFLGIGVFLLTQMIMPVISYKLWEITSYNQNIALSSPDTRSEVLGISVQDINDFPAFFSSNSRTTFTPYKEFFLTIPSLKLEKVKVLVDSNNFEQNLAHLPGSALPGEKGNVFITGHSSFPQFYRPGNFRAIFAHLPEIKKGALITLETEGQQFKYVVEGLRVVDPKETSVINPPDENGRYLTLMTCVPPGFYLKRLVVLARLQ